MIVKIWPIKGAQGLKRSMLYVQDDNKVIKLDVDEDGRIQRRKIIDTQREHRQDADSYFIENEENIERVISYMANEDKTENKYVSGYLCNPEKAMFGFGETWDNAVRVTGEQKRPGNIERENMSFHMVQSFPEDLDISDEEVHQCGLELLQKLQKHQGIVCSHVHPVVNEENEVHGKCKHNHILFNAYVQPEYFDPEHPERIKYNDCQRTYEQLQVWNDEIAIEHGLPIIINPDPEKVYSWKENYEAKRGNSWKERIRLDIEAARRVTGNWDEFRAHMERSGYKLRDGAHLTYTAPDGEHVVRGYKLGTPYTKDGLELYWTIRDRTEFAVEQAVKDNEAPPLWTVAQLHGPLTVGVPLGGKVREGSPTYPLPLDKADRTRETLSTYFNDQDLYDVLDNTGRVVASATGRELVNYLDDLRRGEDERWTQKRQQKENWERNEAWQKEEEERRQKAEENKRKNAYTSNFRNSRTKQNYYVYYRDEKGRRRTTLELLFLLAIVVLKSEDGLWDSRGAVPPGRENEPVFGPTNWKIQNMMDSLHMCEERGLETPAQIDQCVDETGAAYSRARSAFQKTKRAREKMEALKTALDDYEATKDLAERILALPEGPEKAKLMEQYKSEIERYKTAKAVMYGHRVTTQEQINDFRVRYSDIEKNLPVLQEQYDKMREEYRQLKKLQYNTRLAQSEQYCYGPEYNPNVSFTWEELEQRISERDAAREAAEQEQQDQRQGK